MSNTRLLTTRMQLEEIPLHMFVTDQYASERQIAGVMKLDGRTFAANMTSTLEARIPAWLAMYLKTKQIWPTAMRPIRFTVVMDGVTRLRVEKTDIENEPEILG